MPDITGCKVVKKQPRKSTIGSTRAARNQEQVAKVDSVEEPTETSSDAAGDISDHHRLATRRKAPTDSTNQAFEARIQGRQPRDFIAEQVIVIWMLAFDTDDDHPILSWESVY